LLNDESVVPTEELVFSIIGEKKLIWKKIMGYLYDQQQEVSEVWKFYHDGKSWMLRTLKKKNTIFWIRIIPNAFRIAFWFADRLESVILESSLSSDLKMQYMSAKRFNNTRPIYIDVMSMDNFDDIKTLIDLKLDN
jgi:hypothetical protein